MFDTFRCGSHIVLGTLYWKNIDAVIHLQTILDSTWGSKSCRTALSAEMNKGRRQQTGKGGLPYTGRKERKCPTREATSNRILSSFTVWLVMKAKQLLCVYPCVLHVNMQLPVYIRGKRNFCHDHTMLLQWTFRYRQGCFFQIFLPFTVLITLLLFSTDFMSSLLCVLFILLLSDLVVSIV